MQPWPADQVERRPIAALTPYARNARTHSEAQIEQLASSIREWGWTMPVLVDEAGMIIAGHGRVLAAGKVGLADVPVMVARGWSEPQKRAYIIADNKLTENAGWDTAVLNLELSDLTALGFDIPLLGFSADELAELVGGEDTERQLGALAARFGIPPFSVFNAREGWWQDRKRAWISLGIQSELGRGAPIGGSPMPMDRAAAAYKSQDKLTAFQQNKRPNGPTAAPGGGAMPATDYSKSHARGDGRGRAVERTASVAGNGWGAGGPARRDPQFYAKKRKWEKDNGREISTTEFRENYWDGYVRGDEQPA
jgi:hypothetical protein